jgi:endonuclease G, mitochondrial
MAKSKSMKKTRKYPKKSSKPSKPKASTGNDKTIELIRSFIRAKADDYLKDPNITSVGIGYKVVDNKPTKELAVQFSVAEKVATPEQLESLSTKSIPTKITFQGVDIPTDVVKSLKSTRLAPNRHRLLT